MAEAPIFKTPPIVDQPQPDEPRQSFLKRHLLSEILGIVAAGAVLAGGYYYYTSTEEPIPNIQTPVHVEKEPEPMAEWKTYTNADIGFEFKYPQDLFTEDTEEAFLIKSSSQKMYVGGGISPDGVEGTDWIRGYDIVLFKDQVQNVNLASKGEYQVTKLDYKNIDAYSISADVPSSGPDVYIQNPKEPKSFTRIGYSNGLNTTIEADIVFYQILSTFKFVDIQANVNSFATCEAAGYPVGKSKPEVCVTPDQVVFVKPEGSCIQVIAMAKNPETGEVREFPTPCDIPQGWQKVDGVPN